MINERRFDEYATIGSLNEYVLISQDRAEILQFSRDSAGEKWQFAKLQGMDRELEFRKPYCSVPVSAIYDQLEFPAEPPLLRPHDPDA